MMPNWTATFALVAWPLVAAYLYARRPLTEATVWTLLGGLLFLPDGSAIKFPMIPSFDKISIPTLCALIGCAFTSKRRRQSPAKLGIFELLLLVYVLSPLVTSSLNHDPIYILGSVLPGVDSYDGVSTVISLFVFVLPLYLGRRYFQNVNDSEAILRALAFAGLIYSLPMLFEVRMSPQLAYKIYGYESATFTSEIRYGGFRPVVFMQNGLMVAFFMMTCAVASIALLRTRTRVVSVSPLAMTTYLGFILLLCKSAGALTYGLVLSLLVRFTTPRAQMRLALVLASIGLCYPVLRSVEMFPDRALVDLASSFNEERAASLKFRFDQEVTLLAHASERFYFGWGRFGRNRVFTPESGKDDSITDGRWIMTLGQFGIIGFLAEFGLLALPIFRTFSALKYVSTVREQIFLATLSLILAISIIDQLPNSSLSSWTWLIAGALLGRSETLRATMGRAPIVSAGVPPNQILFNSPKMPVGK
jgi:hypothetical protein